MTSHAWRGRIGRPATASGSRQSKSGCVHGGAPQPLPGVFHEGARLYALYAGSRPSTAPRDAVGSSDVASFAAPQGATRSSSAAIIDLTGDNDSSLERWLDANFPDCSDEEF
jgi:hypothetical protein